jgi:CubicO group peptidase (beta-lactamase class C family)
MRRSLALRLSTALLCNATLAFNLAQGAELSRIIETSVPQKGIQVNAATFTGAGLCQSAPERRLRYHGASITKLLTATVVLQLRDEGKLALRDPVGRYVPEFASSPILIEHLLTHSSGLRDRERARGRSTRADVDAYIARLATQRLANEPGTRWAYADAGFNLLGRVIERITGQEYPVAVRVRVLDPLQMTHSEFDRPVPRTEMQLTATDRRGRVLRHPWDMAFLASSGLQTDARDLAKFGAAMLSIAASPDANESSGVLRRQTLLEMTRARMVTEWSGIAQGLGWQLQGEAENVAWRHAGGEAGFESVLVLHPAQDFGVVVMGNQEDWPRFSLATRLAADMGAGRMVCEARNANR